MKSFRVELIVLIVSSFWSNDFLLRTNIWTTIKQQQSPISTLECLFSKDGSTTWTPTFWRLPLLPKSVYTLFILNPKTLAYDHSSFKKSKIFVLQRYFWYHCWNIVLQWQQWQFDLSRRLIASDKSLTLIDIQTISVELLMIYAMQPISLPCRKQEKYPSLFFSCIEELLDLIKNVRINVFYIQKHISMHN